MDSRVNTSASGDWLKKNWKGEGDLAFAGGDDERLPDGVYMPELLPVVSPADGYGVLYLKLPKADKWVKYLGFCGRPWDKASRCPVVWYLTYLPKWQRPRIDVIASPDVSIWKRHTDPIFGPEPLIAVYRAGSIQNVPDPGIPFVASQLIGSPVKLINGADAEEPEPSFHEIEALNHRITEDPITIQPGPNRVAIQQDNGQWCITISNTNPLHPGGFVYEIIPVRKDAALEELGRQRGVEIPRSLLWVIEVRILYASLNVEVTIERTPTMEWIQDMMSFIHVDVETIGDRARWLPDAWVTRSARLEVKVQEVDLSRLPVQGDALPKDLPLAIEQRKTVLQSYGPYLEAMIGFVPVLGTVEDVLHLAYMVMYRESFWGDRVTEGDILAQGLFTMLGVVADAGDAVRLVGLEGKLFGILGGETAPGARIFQSNPGWPKWLKEALVGVVDPQVLDVVEQNRKTLVTALENYTSKVISSNALRDLFEEFVTNPVQKMAESGIVSERLAQAAVHAMNPVDLEGFAKLTATEQDEVLRLWKDALGPQRLPYSEIRRRLQEVDIGLLGQFESKFGDWRALRVLTPDGQSFRVKLLNEGFRRYRARGGTRNAIQWAVSQRSGRYQDLLQGLVGADFPSVLKQSEEYWKVSASAMQQLSGIDPAKFYNTYGKVREATRGLGNWFEVDHVLEKRFLYKIPELRDLIDLDDVSSILVPKNKWVAGQLNEQLSNFPYVHLEKTGLMRSLIPWGSEAEFTLREVFDAHVLVMRHCFATGSIRFEGGGVFDSVLKDQFMAVATALVWVDDINIAKRVLGLENFTSNSGQLVLDVFHAQLDESLSLPAYQLRARNARFRKSN